MAHKEIMRASVKIARRVRSLHAGKFIQVFQSGMAEHQNGVSDQLRVLNYGVCWVGHKENMYASVKIAWRVRLLQAGQFFHVCQSSMAELAGFRLISEYAHYLL